MHGGKSTGPKTPEGRKRVGIAKMTHGTQTKKIRLAHRTAMLKLRALEELAIAHDISWGPKIPGRK